jgi:putative hydrolase of the HAD superfamily
MIELVGFDGDDTLWHSQGYFDQAQAGFEAILANYIDVADAGLHARIPPPSRPTWPCTATAPRR